MRLTAYGGDASDLPPGALQGYLDAVAASEVLVLVARAYRVSQIRLATPTWRRGVAAGKFVVV